MESWIALNEYANKHQVSVSTLRRRIKANKIKYKLEDGKYFLIDDERTGAPLTSSSAANLASTSSRSSLVAESASGTVTLTKLMMDELKRAYLDSLQSKEDQILYLKQQVSDLKTLVMVLEKENARFKAEGRKL